MIGAEVQAVQIGYVNQASSGTPLNIHRVDTGNFGAGINIISTLVTNIPSDCSIHQTCCWLFVGVLGRIDVEVICSINRALFIECILTFESISHKMVIIISFYHQKKTDFLPAASAII